MLSGEGVVMPFDRHIDGERLEHQELLQPQINALGHIRQRRCDEYIDIFERYLVVPLRVLTLEVGVDRHLRLAASPHCGDEIYGQSTAFATDLLKGLFRDVYVHRVPPNVFRWCSIEPTFYSLRRS